MAKDYSPSTQRKIEIAEADVARIANEIDALSDGRGSFSFPLSD